MDLTLNGQMELSLSFPSGERRSPSLLAAVFLLILMGTGKVLTVKDVYKEPFVMCQIVSQYYILYQIVAATNLHLHIGSI